MNTLTLAALSLLCTLGAFAHPAVSVVRDSKGNIYYSDLTHVWSLSPAGVKSIAVRNVHTHQLDIDAQDNLYGEHLWYEGDKTKEWGHRVWRRKPDGTVSDVIPPQRGFLQNYSFVRDAAGTMYWAESGTRTVIRKRTADGRISTLSNGPFRDVRWLTVTPSGVLYVNDSGDILRIDQRGAVRTIARNLRERALSQSFVGERHQVMGIWTDHRGNVYAAVYGARNVKRIDPSGKVAVIATSKAPWSPTGGMMTPQGDLWLLEVSSTNKTRLRKIGRDGKERIY